MKNKVLQSTAYKILIGISIVWGAIVIFRGGYAFGQFLFGVFR